MWKLDEICDEIGSYDTLKFRKFSQNISGNM